MGVGVGKLGFAVCELKFGSWGWQLGVEVGKLGLPRILDFPAKFRTGASVFKFRAWSLKLGVRVCEFGLPVAKLNFVHGLIFETSI